MNGNETNPNQPPKKEGDLLPIREAYEWKLLLIEDQRYPLLDHLLPIREAYEWKP